MQHENRDGMSLLSSQDLIRLDHFLVVVPEIRVLLEPRWLSALGFRQKTLCTFKGFDQIRRVKFVFMFLTLRVNNTILNGHFFMPDYKFRVAYSPTIT